MREKAVLGPKRDVKAVGTGLILVGCSWKVEPVVFADGLELSNKKWDNTKFGT